MKRSFICLFCIVQFALILAAGPKPGMAIVSSSPWREVTGPDGQVQVLYGAESGPLAGDSPEARARDFLAITADRFGLRADTTDLELKSVEHDPLGDHVRFQQTVDGHRVIGGEVDVHLQGGRTYMAASTYRAVRPLAPDATLTAAEAFDRAAGRGGISWPATPDGPPEIVVWPLANDTVWAWSLPIRDSHGLPYDLLVDADVGKLIRSRPRFESLSAPVYPEDPTTTPVREMRDIVGLDSSGQLKGPSVNVYFNGSIGLRGPIGSNLKAGSNGFHFIPGDGRSAEVNAFYHVNRVHDFYKSMGIDAVDYTMPVLTRYSQVKGEPFTNAFYDQTDGAKGLLAIGQGPNGEDISLDASVLYHEYTHFMVKQVNPDLLNSQTLEAFAANEAFADYGAATLSGNPAIADYIAPFLAGRASLRDLRSRRHYPEDTGTIDSRDRQGRYLGYTEGHELGELIGGSLWDLRNLIGAKDADALFLASLPLMNGTTSFPGVRAAIEQADRNLDQSAHADAIKAAFDARGIGTKAGRYLSPEVFDSLRAKAPVYIGPVFRDGKAADTYIAPSELGGTFAVGRRYTLSGFIGDSGATSVTMTVVDAGGKAIPSLTQTQDVSGKNYPSAVDATDGRVFELPLEFPADEAGATVSISLAFQLGTKATWSASTKVDVVADPGPAVAPAPEPPHPAFPILGDSNSDGKITVVDAVAALRAVAGLDSSDLSRVLRLDVAPTHPDGTVGDDAVTVQDVIAILKQTTGRLR